MNTTIDAVAVLPTGSYVPKFTDRCNVIRAASYKRQAERNARFEHLRKLLCKPEATQLPTTIQPEIPMRVKELAQAEQLGTVMAADEPADCAYVRNEGEKVSREARVIRPASYADGSLHAWKVVAEPSGEHQHNLLDLQYAYDPKAQRVDDADLKELAELDRGARVRAQGKVSPTVLIVLNRPKRRVTLKHTGTHDGSKYYGTKEQAEAKARELRAWFGQHNRPARIWVAA